MCMSVFFCNSEFGEEKESLIFSTFEIHCLKLHLWIMYCYLEEMGSEDKFVAMI